jgi:hypothetical protein
MIAIINSVLAVAVLAVGSFSAVTSTEVPLAPACTTLCKIKYEKPSAGVCAGWVVNFTPNANSQNGGCKCDAEWPWNDLVCIRDNDKPACIVDVTVTVESGGQWIWQKTRCNAVTPALYQWSCQQVGARPPGGTLFSRALRCWGCGCAGELNIEGYTQACGAVNNLSECNTPPDNPPAGFQCRFEIKASCTSCDNGGC